ncbi:MAG: hypothetical protein IKU72_03780 [Oscillospiraceae bacterium]|nr:hypothetical protein [Oscillospiraceae bacterium]
MLIDAVKAVKAKLENREKIFSTVLQSIHGNCLADVYKDAGLDFLVLDMEHGPFSPENSSDFIAKCNDVGLPVIVRVQDCGYYYISKPLDRGADGIMIPNVKTMEQVETAIKCMRLPPVGAKGFGAGPQIHKGEKIEEFNTNRMLILQIESKAGTDALDEMLTKYGHEIAGIIIGPGDMSVDLGYPFDLTAPPLLENIARTVDICLKHNKSVGMWMPDKATAEKWYKAGMNIFWYGTDLIMLSNELNRAKALIDSL